MPVVRFDTWAAEAQLDRLDALKIDVEGGEGLVIAGMHESLRRLRPRLLVVELKHSHYKEAGASPADVRRQLASLGFQRRGVALFGNEVFEPER